MSNMQSQFNRSRKQPTRIGGKIAMTIFFTVFFAFGAGFTFLLVREAYRSAAVRFWNKTDCLITSSSIKEIKNDGGYDYQFCVTYQYNGPLAPQGNPEADYQYHGTVVQPDYKGDSDYRAAQKLLDAYPAQLTAQCLVNPHDPTKAVLRPGSAWIALGFPIPLIFVVIGLAGMISPWWQPWKSVDAGDASPIQARKSARAGVAFGGLFFVIGLCFFLFKTVPDITHIQQSKSWPTAPCVITHSGVRFHSGKSTTYSIDVLFRYEFNGRKYASSRYDFSTSSDSGYQSKQDAVRKIPAKAKTICYVDPADPTIAVLHRSGDVIMGTIFPLIFGGVGLLIMTMARRAARRNATMAAAVPAGSHAHGSSHPTMVPMAGPGELKPRATPVGAFLTLAIFTLVWNVLIYVFFVAINKPWQRPRHFDFCSMLFFIPFALVGVGLIGGTIVSFLKLFNPTVSVTLNPRAVLPGQSVQLTWRFAGRYDVIDRLHIQAICQRQLTTGSGKNSSTTITDLMKVPVLDSTKSREFGAGRISFAIPLDAQPSIETGFDRILWSVRVEGHIQHWPEVDESFAFIVLPAEVTP